MLEELIIGLDRVGEKKAAVTLLDALSRHSFTFQQYDEVAKCFFKIKEYEKAFQFAEKAYSKSPMASYAVVYNLINAANHANYPERAMILIRQLEIIHPNDVDIELEKSFSLFLLNEKNKAEEILRKQLINPKINNETKNKILFNLGTYELLRDEFQNGLRKFITEGRKMEFWKNSILPFSQWDGKINNNKILIIVAEAGIGDEFISVRFMNHIKNLGMRCIWLTNRKDICDIFNRNGYESITNIKQLESNLSLEKLVWAYSMDLPIILNSEYKDLWKGPYLKADEKLVQQYGEMIESPKLKIGLRWQGNPGYDQDLHRSIPLKEMYDSLKHLDAEFYSLQRDDGLEELEGLPITDLSDKLTDFDQTLAIIENLDLVVSSCTSVVHAAAAMGKPVVVISPISSYYVWCHTPEKSPWYGDHVTILRQQKPRVWDEPLAQLKEFVDANYHNR